VPPAKKTTKRVNKKVPTARKQTSKKTSMSASHKQALAEGRDASRAVRAYLDALDQHRPKRGRKLDPASVRKRIALIDDQVKRAGGFERLNLLADKAELEGKLAGADVTVDLSDLRKAFVKHAKTYGERKRISYGTWRAAGVSAEDLKAAGIARTRG
jgi:hypothetical protein